MSKNNTIKITGIEKRGSAIRATIYSENKQIKNTIKWSDTQDNITLVFAIRQLIQSYVNRGIITTELIEDQLYMDIYNGKFIFNQDNHVSTTSNPQLIKNRTMRPLKDILDAKLNEYFLRIDNNSYDKNKIRESTYNKYRTSILGELIPNFGSCKLNTLNKMNVIEWIHTLKIKFKTFRDYVIPLKAIYDDALSLKIINKDESIFDDNYIINHAAKILPSGQKEPHPFNWGEIEKILKQPDSFMKNLILFGIFTGVRISELACIRIKDLDLQNGTIKIWQQYNRKKETALKTKKSVREVYIWDRLIETILRQLSLCAEFNQDEFLFFNPNTGKRWRNDKINKQMTNYLAELNIPRRTPHEMRHTFASILVATENIWWVADQMGHETIELLINTYAKWIPDESINRGYEIKNQKLYRPTTLKLVCDDNVKGK